MFEVEIKSLVSNPDQVKALLLNQSFVFQSTETQLNHYFSYDDISLAYLFQNLKTNKQYELSNVLGRGNSFSIRTREVNNNECFFVIKYSVNDLDSTNGNIRKELEIKVDYDCSTLDQILLDSGLQYASKWSRTRDTYTKENVTATIDLNSGYGYLLELEVLVNTIEETEQAKSLVDSTLESMNLQVLNPKVLNNMFKYYEQNWEKFYNTTNYFGVSSTGQVIL